MERVGCYQCASQEAQLLYRDSETGCAIAKCRKCGAIYTRDRWTEEEVKRKYAEDVYYTERLVASWTKDWLPSQHSELEAIEELMPRKGRLLDVGCGGGAFVYVARQRGWEAFGIDLSEAAIRHACEYWGIDENVIVCGNFEFWSFSDPFDVITAFHVLEHVYQPFSFLARAHQLLTQRGLLVIAVPNFGSVDVKVYPEIFRAVVDLPFHVMHFTPKSLSRLLESNGFKVARKRFFPAKWVVRKLRPFFRLLKPMRYQQKNNPVNDVGLDRPMSVNRTPMYRMAILRFLSYCLPGSYMVFYAQRKND